MHRDETPLMFKQKCAAVTARTPAGPICGWAEADILMEHRIAPSYLLARFLLKDNFFRPTRISPAHATRVPLHMTHATLLGGTAVGVGA
jgi:hypothetical protein